MSLNVCEKCRRHARGERCPFCGAAIEMAAPSRTRTNRTVMFAGAAAVVAVAASACGGTEITDSDAAATDAAHEAAQDSSSVPFYGAVCPTCDAGNGD